MNFKKLNLIINKAKKIYVKNEKEFSSLLSNSKNNFNYDFLSNDFSTSNLSENEFSNSSVNNDFRNNNNYTPNSTISQPQQVPNYNQPQLPQNYNQPQPQQVVMPTGINVINKNYITPKALSGKISKEEEEKTTANLAKMPDSLLKKSTTDWEPINYKNVDDSYDLYELSKVHIKFDDKTKKLMYNIIEPELTEEELEILEELKRGFVYVFEKYSPEFIDISEDEFISKGIKNLCLKYLINLNEERFKKISYYIKRDFLGLEMLEPIMHDPYIEDISCDGLNIPIFVNHLKYGPIEVNRKYKDPKKLNSFIVKLAQKSNQEVSLSKPILQGALPDGSRVEAIYGKEVSEKGSSYTIRKFRAEPFTPIHLMEFGTMPSFLLAYLWLAVENKQSLLVSGGTATGKTTILNALSLFVPPTSKIVSIEDTPEINLPHEHWLPMIARESEGKGEVSMFDLLKASLRERPDYIIVGEIRGKEAAILFQGMATGHAGLGTVHAEKFSDLVNRMTIDPINLPKQLLTELKLVLFQKQVKVKNNLVRRTFSVVEVIDYNAVEDEFQTNEFLRFNPAEDSFAFKEKSAIMSHLLSLRGGKEESLWTEIEKRKRILDLMHKYKILEFEEVTDIIKYYYKNPLNIFDYVDEVGAKRGLKESKNEK
jgi:flagellar protein FlaI